MILYINDLDRLQKFIATSHKCLKEGGRLLICTLDIASASFYPEVFKILNFLVKPLTEDGAYTDGCPVEITITKDCIVTSYHREFETLKRVMEEIGFKDIKKHELFLDDFALQAFNAVPL